jgi:2-oxo-4-hydroxy-4-carboxy-5-ureidoimidazoline decarboxylase
MEPWQKLDSATADEAKTLLRTCCGASRWIDRMVQRRPFGDMDTLLAVARDEWFALSESDWREAFAHHPKIGDRAALERRFAPTRHLSEKEQAGVNAASQDVLTNLADGNRMYEDRFGYIFIVCAIGRSATEMLTLLRSRLHNDPAMEIRVAAEEQAKITGLRLARLGAE